VKFSPGKNSREREERERKISEKQEHIILVILRFEISREHKLFAKDDTQVQVYSFLAFLFLQE
jgi:hypothetical protein